MTDPNGDTELIECRTEVVCVDVIQHEGDQGRFSFGLPDDAEPLYWSKIFFRPGQ